MATKEPEINATVIRGFYSSLLRTLPADTPVVEKKQLRSALELAIAKCAGHPQIYGSPSIYHSLSVARIVTVELGLGHQALIAALLHDLTDILDFRTPEFELEYGKSVVEILNGLSRISTIDTSRSKFQASSFRRLVLALAEDIRVIFIKLAERLDIMRHLSDFPEKDRLTIAAESYFLYAPMAHRLGFYTLKSEMEDLAMKYLEPADYEYIQERIKQTSTSRNRLIREFIAPVREKLTEAGLSFTIKSRTKSVHSIWQKMKTQGVEFEEVFDLFAVRIILDSKPEKEKSDCWQVYSVIADIYQPNPSRMRDWISIPKSNGYESLHTTLVGPKGKWVEVQIRSTRMDEIAERGLAAHFRYKGSKGDGGIDKWLGKMREILDSPDKENEDIIDEVKSGLYSDDVFVFTPKGEIKQLPAGSTLLDFAFEIHTEVGARCTGGKINGKNVTIKHVLSNGDQVSVQTSKTQKPKYDWLSIIKTSKARNRIKQALSEEKLKVAAEGKEILQRRLKNWKIPFGDAMVKRMLQKWHIKTASELYYQIAIEKINLLDIKELLGENPNDQQAVQTATEDQQPALVSFEEPRYSDYLIIEDRVEGLDYRLAKCCNPVYGNRVFGFVTISEGVKIHRNDCPNAENMKSRYPYRVVQARWTESAGGPLISATLRITGSDDIGIMGRVSDLLKAYRVSVKSISSKMENGKFTGSVSIMIPNNNLLQGLIRKIQSVPGVVKVVKA